MLFSANEIMIELDKHNIFKKKKMSMLKHNQVGVLHKLFAKRTISKFQKCS